MPRRAALAAAAALATVILAACSGGGSPPSPSPTPSASQPSVSPSPSPTGSGVAASGPQPPATGAWVGAWVKPAVENQQGRVDAVAGFEAAIGRQLDLVNVYHSWTDEFPSSADLQFVQQGKVLMISWNGNDVAGIVSGSQDAVITAHAAAIKELGSPILLRWRWEMNRPNLATAVGSPAQYVAAWKHIRTIFRTVGATNVGWVWCPLATSFDATQGPAFYPGDDQVDWLCTDVYPGPTRASFGAVSAEFMAWAAGHDKPIVIGEYGSEGSNPQQSQWIAGAAAYALAHPQIKAMTYFDADRVENGVDRNFRLEGTTGPLQAFRAMGTNAWFQQRAG